MNTKTFGVLCAMAMASLAAAPVVAMAADVRLPAKSVVRTPLVELVKRPGTPLSAAPIDLAKSGYAEQEYFISGTAKRYIFPDKMADAIPVDDGHKYKTRIMVRRPIDPAKFNGTVVVEWQNVTIGQDIDFNWATSHEYLMERGYAVISVSAQLVGINHLKRWNKDRYGDLTAAAEDTLPKDPLGTGDVLSWDIFSQAIQAVRKPGAVNILPGMTPKYVIATGESQGGRRLTQYYNSIDPLHRLVDGMVFYDPGYNTWSLLRADNPTKLISVGSEVHTDGRTVVPDSKYTRRWEVAGTSHLSHWDMNYVDAMTIRDKSLDLDGKPVNVVQDKIVGCGKYPLWSAVPFHKVLNAAFDQVNNWIIGTAVASPGKPLDRDTDGKSLRHTADGKTFGGIQLAEFAYPTAENLGYLNPGPGFCRNGGYHRFYTAEELNKMYPDKQAYIVNVAKLTSENVKAGYILPDDAMETITAALEPFK
jgi:hypothetical protein